MRNNIMPKTNNKKPKETTCYCLACEELARCGKTEKEHTCGLYKKEK